MSLHSHSVLASSVRETSQFFTGLPHLERFGRSRALRRQIRPILAIAFPVAALTFAPRAGAQSCTNASELQASLTTWASPLDRRVSLHERDTSLRDALDHLASAGGIELSYASETIPL